MSENLKNWPLERTCPECGKVFCVRVQEEWRFKENGVLLCSWGCVRTRERRREERSGAAKAKRSKKLTPKQKEAAIRMFLEQGMDVKEISDRLGVRVENVYYYRKKIEEGGK